MPSVKNQDKRDMDGIIRNVNENKTKKLNSFLLQIEEENMRGWKKIDSKLVFEVLERDRVASLYILVVRTVCSLRAK